MQSDHLSNSKSPLNPPEGRRRVAVLIPCFNESGRVGVVVQSVRRVMPDAVVVVVNDGSADDTSAEALAAGAIVLNHASNMGYGAALETGYMYAYGNGFDYVLQMDGDGQHIAEELRSLLSPLEEDRADMVIGSRYGHPGNAFRPAFMRRAGHRLFALLLFAATGRFFRDPTSGFQGLNRRALELLAGGVLPYDYPDSDVLLMALMSGLRVVEIPVRMRPRTGGESMHSGLAEPIYYGLKMSLSMFIVLLNFRLWRKWKAVHGSPATAGKEGMRCTNASS